MELIRRGPQTSLETFPGARSYIDGYILQTKATRGVCLMSHFPQDRDGSYSSHVPTVVPHIVGTCYTLEWVPFHVRVDHNLLIC